MARTKIFQSLSDRRRFFHVTDRWRVALRDWSDRLGVLRRRRDLKRVLSRSHPGASTVQVTAVALVLVLGLSGCISSGGRAPIPLANVDMARMYGGWYLVATRKNGFERGLVAPYDVYSQRPDGDIREDFYVRRGSFQAPLKHFTIHDWVLPDTHNAHWRVQVLWPINLPFLLIYKDPSYRYVLFGEDDRKLGWIYSRTPTVPEADYQDLLSRFRALGYDTSSFVKFVQTPEQIRAPGFWSDGVH